MTNNHSTEPDSLLTAAKEAIVSSNNPSAGYLQRRFKIGFNRANALMKSMEGEIVTEPDATGWRRMLKTGDCSPDDPRSEAIAANASKPS